MIPPTPPVFSSSSHQQHRSGGENVAIQSRFGRPMSRSFLPVRLNLLLYFRAVQWWPEIKSISESTESPEEVVRVLCSSWEHPCWNGSFERSWKFPLSHDGFVDQTQAERSVWGLLPGRRGRRKRYWPGPPVSNILTKNLSIIRVRPSRQCINNFVFI